MSLLHVPSDDELMRQLGFDRWQLGLHRRQQHHVAGARSVHTLWRVKVKPGFVVGWVLAGVLAEDSVEPRATIRAWRKAILADDEGVAVIEHEADPVAKYLLREGPPRQSLPRFLDGIGYDVRFDSPQQQGEFQYSNPESPSWRELERLLFGLAERISATSGERLARVIRLWQRFLKA
jgi:hypothetical protein